MQKKDELAVFINAVNEMNKKQYQLFTSFISKAEGMQGNKDLVMNKLIPLSKKVLSKPNLLENLNKVAVDLQGKSHVNLLHMEKIHGEKMDLLQRELLFLGQISKILENRYNELKIVSIRGKINGTRALGLIEKNCEEIIMAINYFKQCEALAVHSKKILGKIGEGLEVHRNLVDEKNSLLKHYAALDHKMLYSYNIDFSKVEDKLKNVVMVIDDLHKQSKIELLEPLSLIISDKKKMSDNSLRFFSSKIGEKEVLKDIKRMNTSSELNNYVSELGMVLDNGIFDSEVEKFIKSRI